MAVYFVDSSGIVKRYAKEVGSAWIVGITDPIAANEIYVVRITAVEVISALVHSARGGSIDATDAAAAITQLKNDLHSEYQIIEVTPALADRAMSLAEKHALPGYDAVQLSAAYELQSLAVAHGQPPITLVAADNELNRAAVAEGLTVDDPNSHP